MTLLSDVEIKRRLYEGGLKDDEQIVITRGDRLIDPKQVQESSINLHLAPEYRRLRRKWRLSDLMRVFPRGRFQRVLDVATTSAANIGDWIGPPEVMDPSKGLIVNPEEVLLAVTEEFVQLPGDVAALVVGRQSYARLGIQVVLSANFMVAGHYGRIPMQILNASRSKIRLYPGLPVCQLALFSLDKPSSNPYHRQRGAKQWAETEPQIPRFFDDPEVRDLPRKNPQFVWPELRANLNLTIVIAGVLLATVIGLLNLLK